MDGLYILPEMVVAQPYQQALVSDQCVSLLCVRGCYKPAARDATKATGQQAPGRTTRNGILKSYPKISMMYLGTMPKASVSSVVMARRITWDVSSTIFWPSLTGLKYMAMITLK